MSNDSSSGGSLRPSPRAGLLSGSTSRPLPTRWTLLCVLRETSQGLGLSGSLIRGLSSLGPGRQGRTLEVVILTTVMNNGSTLPA